MPPKICTRRLNYTPSRSHFKLCPPQHGEATRYVGPAATFIAPRPAAREVVARHVYQAGRWRGGCDRAGCRDPPRLRQRSVSSAGVPFAPVRRHVPESASHEDAAVRDRTGATSFVASDLAFDVVQVVCVSIVASGCVRRPEENLVPAPSRSLLGVECPHRVRSVSQARPQD